MFKELGVFFVFGMGVVDFEENYKCYVEGLISGISRVVFYCFCDILVNLIELMIGGVL